MADLNATLVERGSRYGDFTDHAQIAQQLQDVMRREPVTHFSRAGWDRLTAVQRQALTAIADKIARILSGDPNHTDNWHDIQGYAKLAEDRCVDTETAQLPFPNEHDPLAGQHLARREQDEYVCTRCSKRWGVEEDAPEACK